MSAILGLRNFLLTKNVRKFGLNSAKDPKGDSRLCELHFDDSQFESKRQDGRRKLKPNAIPTIFINKENTNEVLQEIESSVGVLSEENEIDRK